ncbi:hypothetical protein [Ruminococcus sp.]|uniref:hypothetical protein n=1 Tax=Ruminococcus sp. TaxID=41978 RepID=UPI0025DDFEB0|nr:hypothetical protein [Ruminococcus sp.]
MKNFIDKRERLTIAKDLALITEQEFVKKLSNADAIAYCNEHMQNRMFGAKGEKIYVVKNNEAELEFDSIDEFETQFANHYANLQKSTEEYEEEASSRAEAILKIVAEADLSELEKYKLFIDYEIEKRKGNNPPNPFTMENLWYK